MIRYRGWETATSLLLAYESLARAHESTLRRADAGDANPQPYHSYMHAFALLILNASIIEGTMRTILTEKVKTDLNAAITRGKREGRTEHDSPTRLLQKFLVDLETSGGWENLVKTSGMSYYGASLDQDVSADVKEGIQALFVLRNVLAHGTTLIQPSEKMTDDMKGEYPFTWQSKLGGAASYLEKHLKRGGIFENLADPRTPEHFMDVTKQFFTEIEPRFAPIDERAANTIDLIKRYRFGSINFTQ